MILVAMRDQDLFVLCEAFPGAAPDGSCAIDVLFATDCWKAFMREVDRINLLRYGNAIPYGITLA